MPKFGDRVRSTTTTTGTGTITLSGSVSGFTDWSSAATGFSTGDSISYAIIGQGTTEWELGLGTLINSVTISRDIVRSSSNANALVNFSAGTKDMICTPSAVDISRSNYGKQYNQANNWAMP